MIVRSAQQYQLILGLMLLSRECNLPSEIQNSQAINVCLVLRWRVHSVNTGLDETACECSESVAGVDSNGTILRPHPFPLTFRVQDLKSSNGLPE